MVYRAKITKEGKYWLAEFSDCPGCQTFGETEVEALSMAKEALEGWLEAHLVTGRVPPKPRKKTGVAIRVSPSLGFVLQIRWLREERGWSQKDLARRVGVSQQAIAKIEDPDSNPTLDTLSKVAEGLGMHVDVSLERHQLQAVRA
jgi:predicted RNase H-like HicB family nuclease/DNA-binding XRE family transcriptional regulator